MRSWWPWQIGPQNTYECFLHQTRAIFLPEKDRSELSQGTMILIEQHAGSMLCLFITAVTTRILQRPIKGLILSVCTNWFQWVWEMNQNISRQMTVKWKKNSPKIYSVSFGKRANNINNTHYFLFFHLKKSWTLY